MPSFLVSSNPPSMGGQTNYGRFAFLGYIIKCRSKVSVPSFRSLPLPLSFSFYLRLCFLPSLAATILRSGRRKKKASNVESLFFPLSILPFLVLPTHFRASVIPVTRLAVRAMYFEKPSNGPYGRIVKRTSRRRWRSRLERRKVGQLSADESNRRSPGPRFTRSRVLIYDTGIGGTAPAWFAFLWSIDRNELSASIPRSSDWLCESFAGGLERRRSPWSILVRFPFLNHGGPSLANILPGTMFETNGRSFSRVELAFPTRSGCSIRRGVLENCCSGEQ